MNTANNLIQKYDIPGPRYTSYPTVPAWKEDPIDTDLWKAHVRSAFQTNNNEKGISLYIHLPYCESLCTYCGCNTRITVNHSVERPYIDTLLREWSLYLKIFDDTPQITEIHLGGGTPTFFSPEHLTLLIEGITQKAITTSETCMSFEAHPNNTTRAHMQALYDLGFRRMSLGIQDFDLAVQKIVHRIQSYETVASVVDTAREIGYTSINFDLIYGLPLQNKNTISDTFDKVAQLHPDRIAYYSYAHVPWVKPGQRSFSDKDLPSATEKRELYELGKRILAAMQYYEIGMDHFALATDELYLAAESGTLHRNFMGYTIHSSDLVIGLGASSIGDTGSAYAQNVKKVEDYKALVYAGKLPVYRGHFLTDEEISIKQHISRLMCQFQTSADTDDPLRASLFHYAESRLSELVADQLIEIKNGQLYIMPAGRPFVRNVCMAFDKHYWQNNSVEHVFSQTV